MALAAANADDGGCEDGRQAELPGAIDNLGGILAIDKRFCDDEARAQNAVS